MLLEFSCRNHRSIRDTVTLSLIAGPDDHMDDQTLKSDKGRILRSAVIYGANGSGKSNIIGAIGFMKNVVTGSVNYKPGTFINHYPHRLDKTWNSSFSVKFVTDGVRYSYGFSLHRGLVTEEYLYYYPNKRRTTIFERNGEDFKTGYNFRGKLNTCRDVLKPNRLLLSCAANFSKVEEIEKVFRYIDEQIVIYDSGVQSNWLNYSLSKMKEDSDAKAQAIKYLNWLGVAVKDIEITVETRPAVESGMEIPPFISEEYKKQLMQGVVQIKNARLVYDGFSVDLLGEESEGIKKMIAFLLPFFDVYEKGGVLLCDELEQGIHEYALHELIKGLTRSENNNFQLIFNTHSTSILSLDIFRRDQIWFTELRPEDRSTALYSLASISGVRKEDNFGRAYLMGRYDALPILNRGFIDSVDKKN